MLKKKNFAKSLITNDPLAIGGLSLTITTGEGAKFPATGATNLFRGVIWGAAFNSPEADPDREVVEAYQASSDTFTIVRAQESTSAKEWPQGSNFMLTATAGVFDEYDASLASEVTTPDDADLLGVWVGGILKKLTWANLKATLKTYFDTLYPPQDGWIAASGTWSASDANTISIASTDLTGVIQKGDKIKVTNNSSVKYFYISTAPAFSTNTTFDVAGEVDLVAGAISSPYFSKIDNPQGFKKGEMYYSARGYNGSDVNLGDNAVTKATLSTAHDKNSMISSNKITAPITGYYRVAFGGRVVSSGGKLNDGAIYLYKNNSALLNYIQSIVPGTGGGVYNLVENCLIELPLNKGDYLELYALGNSSDSSACALASGSGYLDVQFVSV